jgi:hypothetical protein
LKDLDGCVNERLDSDKVIPALNSILEQYRATIIEKHPPELHIYEH